MTTGMITNTKGRIVPLQNILKRTKQIDISSNVTFTSSAPSPIVRYATAIFYVDSAGVWRMRFNIGATFTSTTQTGGYFSITGIAIKVRTSGMYTVAAHFGGSVSGAAQAYFYAESGSNSNRVYVDHVSAAVSSYGVYGDVELNAEPTTYTIAANMEVAGDVVAYIPDASASNAGLINLLAQTFAGVKNFQDGIKIGGNETVITYDEGSWTPTISSSAGSITSYTSTGSYVRIGKIVVITFSYTITNNGTGSGYGKVDSLPFTIASPGASGSQRIAGTTGYLVTLDGMSGTSQIRIYDYANLYPWATNASSFGTLTYLTT